MYPADKIQVSVEGFLQNPTLVQSTIDTKVGLSGTIGDYLFSSGPANSGAVLYERITGTDAEGVRDAGIVAPGAEFPTVDDALKELLPATVKKYGGKDEITWEAKRRNQVGTLTQKVDNVARKVVRAVNVAALNALENDPDIRTLDVGTSWGTASGNTKIGSLFRAIGMINNHPIEGYEADIALINPEDMTEYLLSDEDVRESYPRESNLNPVLSGELTGLVGLEWVASSLVSRGEIWVAQKNMTGSLNDENNGQLQTDVFPDRNTQVDVIQAWRDAVTVINNPLSAVKLVGFHS